MHKIEYHATPIAGIEMMCAKTDRSFPRHTHDQYGVGIMEEGGHRSRTGRHVVVATPGSLIFVNPGEVHDGHSLHGASRSWRMIYFDPTEFNRLASQVGERDLPQLEFPRAAFDDGPLRRMLFRTFAALSRKPIESILLDSSLLAIVARLDRLAGAAHQRVDHCAPNIRRALELIHADPTSSELTLQRLADEVGITRYHLIRTFERELSLTPHAYIVQRRLARARAWMLTGMPLAEIAALAGFADQSHLSKAFARQFGVTPGRYCRSVR